MEKIKFVADTACDIVDEMLEKYYIDMPSVPIAVDGEEFFERKSFSIKEFYSVLQNAKEIPTTSRVPIADYYECYKKAYDEGFTDIISVTINAGGSSTHASAQMAKDQLFNDFPEASEKLKIHVVDSRTYSIAYGLPVVEAAKMAEDGKTVKEILDYLYDFFEHCEIYLSCFSLEYAKRSGRIGAAAAFVGDVLGLRPIIQMAGGQTKTIDKVRGDKNVPLKLRDSFLANCTDKNALVAIVYGNTTEAARDLRVLLEQQTGKKVPMYNAGASIIINSGPNMVAFVCRGAKRPYVNQ